IVQPRPGMIVAHPVRPLEREACHRGRKLRFDIVQDNASGDESTQENIIAVIDGRSLYRAEASKAIREHVARKRATKRSFVEIELPPGCARHQCGAEKIGQIEALESIIQKLR